MGAYFPFFPIWLHDVKNGISKAETGIVFGTISLFALLFQPVFGLVSDKLGLKKAFALDNHRITGLRALLSLCIGTIAEIEHLSRFYRRGVCT